MMMKYRMYGYLVLFFVTYRYNREVINNLSYKVNMEQDSDALHEKQKVRCTVQTAILWGENAENIKSHPVDAPSFGMMDTAQMRKTHTGVCIRLSSTGTMHLMKQFADNDITNEKEVVVWHFSEDGKYLGRTLLPEPAVKDMVQRKVVDYVVDKDVNIYLLEMLSSGGKSMYHLSKSDVKGKMLWEIKGTHSVGRLDMNTLEGVFSRIFIDDRSRLYVLAGGQSSAIGEFDGRTGKMMNVYALSEGNTNGVAFNQHNIIRNVYVAKNREYALSLFDLSGSSEKTIGDKAGVYNNLVGADKQMNCYTYTSYSGFKKISPEGSVIAELPIRDVVIRADNKSVYTNWKSADTLFVTSYSVKGEITTYIIKLPPEQNGSGATNNYRLVKVDAENRFYFHTNEAPMQAGKIVVFSDKGTLEKEILPPFDLFAIESNFDFTNQVTDGNGNVYMPVTDPEGIKIVKLTF